MGCGSIAIKLQAAGHSVSEATVGRILRDLDFAGFTEKAGFRGRKLSELGTDRLTELDGRERRSKWGAELMDAVQGHTKENLLEVLTARKAIESELAYLAAQNAIPDEVRRLKAVLDRQRAVLDCGDGAASEDVDFHNIIAEMARNRVLAAAVALIRQDTQLSPVLEHIRLHVHSLVYVDHQKIVNDIASGNKEGARAAMVEHINNLIRDVEKYWELID
jgi:GntR family L-lactate dehydrogenase operon transcriptional regulator